MNDTYAVGEYIRLNKDYSWGGGKFAGQVVEITEVHDHRELTDRDDALIYGASRHYSGASVNGLPVLPSDIDEEYDHYEAKRAADFSRFFVRISA